MLNQARRDLSSVIFKDDYMRYYVFILILSCHTTQIDLEMIPAVFYLLNLKVDKLSMGFGRLGLLSMPWGCSEYRDPVNGLVKLKSQP